MKPNFECIKIIMITLENNLDVQHAMDECELMNYPLVQSFSESDIKYSLKLLNSEKMIECDVSEYINGSTHYLISDITAEGHKLCNSFADKKLWGKIEPMLSKITTIAELITALTSLASAMRG